MSEFTHAELKLRFAESLDIIDRLTAELAAEKKFSQDRIDDIEELHLELARYKQGVEVRDFVNHYGILENEFELHSHLRDKQVRVLVMKVEE